MTKSFKERKYYPGVRCAYCSTHLEYNEATVDHVRPISKGGTNTDSNMTFSCSSCNKLKGNIEPNTQAMNEFLARVSPEYMVDTDKRINELKRYAQELESKKRILEAQRKRYAKGLAKYNSSVSFLTIADALLSK